MTAAPLLERTVDSFGTVHEDARARPTRQRLIVGGVALVVVLVWVLWRTGPRAVPGLHGFSAVAGDWPSATIDEEFAYTLRVPLGQILYQLLPIHGPTAFLVLHAGCLAIVAVLLLTWLWRQFGAEHGMLAGCVIVLAPITPVLLLWVGMYDAFSMLAWVLVLIAFTKQPAAQFAAAMLAGFQNFEQSAVGLLVVLLIPALSRSAGLAPRAAPLLAGLVGGKAALELWLHLSGAAPGSRLSYLGDGKLVELLASASSALPVLVWSALGGLWIFALLGARSAYRRWPRRDKIMLAVAVLIWLTSGVLAEDQTRVLAMTSFPAVVMGAVVIAGRHGDVSAMLRTPGAWLLLLAPPVVLWNGELLPIGIGA